MVIGVEARRLTRDKRGIGRYLRAILPRLCRLRPDLRLVLYLSDARDEAPLRTLIDAIPDLRDRVSYRVSRQMRAADADVFWFPWNTTGPRAPQAAVVVTMHDVVPVALPDPRLRAFPKNLLWRRRYLSTAREATVLLADSAFTAREAERVLGFPMERILVAPLAADDFTGPDAAHDDDVLSRLGVRRPFVLCVGAADRRKNLDVLLRAMPSILEQQPDVQLVMAGPRRVVTTDPAWCRTLGFVSDDELAVLYRCAHLLVMPSRYEGFGLPVLEAMRYGTPVVSARGSALDEVGGDAALWFDADDHETLATNVAAVLSDPSLRESLRDAGLAQAARFSWDDTARRTLAAFDDAIRRHSPGVPAPSE